MKTEITAHAYHLRYVPEEDRILLAVALSPEAELGVIMTRRLTRNLVAALAKLAGERSQAAASAGATRQLRDTILDFEHSQSVARAVAEGTMRDERREKPLAVPARLAREVNIVTKSDGSIALVFDNPGQALTLAVSPDRIHMVIETFVQMAERAGWDFPPMANWLDASKQVAGTAPKVLN